MVFFGWNWRIIPITARDLKRKRPAFCERWIAGYATTKETQRKSFRKPMSFSDNILLEMKGILEEIRLHVYMEL